MTRAQPRQNHFILGGLQSFPAAFQHEYIFEPRFVAQTLRDDPAGAATLAAAINNDPLLRRPGGQRIGQLFIPVVFVQRDSTVVMTAGKFRRRPRIDPKRAVAPTLCLRCRDQLGSRDGRSPGNALAQIQRLDNAGQKSQRQQKKNLPRQGSAHASGSGPFQHPHADVIYFRCCLRRIGRMNDDSRRNTRVHISGWDHGPSIVW